MAQILLLNMCAKAVNIVKESISDLEFSQLHKMHKKDFTRKRYLNFENTFLLILSTFSSSLRDLVSRMCDSALNIPVGITSSAICQAKQKVSFSAFVDINSRLVDFFYTNSLNIKKWKGFRLVAVDGSQINLPEKSEAQLYFGKINNSTGETVRARASVLYDVLNEIAIANQIMPFCADEISMLMYMRESLRTGDLLLADRYYPSFYVFKYLAENKIDFCFRISTSKWKVVKKFVESGKKEDICTLFPSRKVSNKCLSNAFGNDPIQIRLVRVELESGEIEVLATSLVDKEKYPEKLFKDLYIKRWGVETFYCTLKERMALEKFSGVKNYAILQDFHAKILINNLTRIISSFAQQKIDAKSAKRKLKYKVNHTSALNFVKNKFLNFFYGVLCRLSLN